MEPEFFSGVRTPALNNYASRQPSCLLESIERLYNPRLSLIPVLKAVTDGESWVQRHRNGFESRTARINLKEDIDEETRAERKEQQRKALCPELCERIQTGYTTATNEKEDQRKS